MAVSLGRQATTSTPRFSDIIINFFSLYSWYTLLKKPARDFPTVHQPEFRLGHLEHPPFNYVVFCLPAAFKQVEQAFPFPAACSRFPEYPSPGQPSIIATAGRCFLSLRSPDIIAADLFVFPEAGELLAIAAFRKPIVSFYPQTRPAISFGLLTAGYIEPEVTSTPPES